MPAAPNNTLTVYTTLCTLALAWDGLTGGAAPLLKPGNLVRHDVAAKPYGRNLPGKLPADVVEIELTVTGEQPDPKAARTFCIQPDIQTVSYEWRILGPDYTLNLLTQAEAELRACMKAAGTQLGIPAIVARWEWAWRPETAPKAESGGHQRKQVRITQRITIKG
jgi:hypothetical protein